MSYHTNDKSTKPGMKVSHTDDMKTGIITGGEMNAALDQSRLIITTEFHKGSLG